MVEPTRSPTLRDVLAAIDTARLPGRELRHGVHAALTASGMSVREEIPVAGGIVRLDLIVDRVAIEIRRTGSPQTITRQLRRLAADDRLDALVLITTRRAHRRVPSTLDGKPVAVVVIPAGRP
ncbi:MAG: hypothetical protein LC798_12205 [Chloroflexi bacterium]|nr:hypothetical protein [Chloroflexota bacterium]